MRRDAYGHDVDKDRCAVCGGVIVQVDGPVHRWGEWWNAGEWIHRLRSDLGHPAAPGRELDGLEGPQAAE